MNQDFDPYKNFLVVQGHPADPYGEDEDLVSYPHRNLTSFLESLCPYEIDCKGKSAAANRRRLLRNRFNFLMQDFGYAPIAEIEEAKEALLQLGELAKEPEFILTSKPFPGPTSVNHVKLVGPNAVRHVYLDSTELWQKIDIEEVKDINSALYKELKKAEAETQKKKKAAEARKKKAAATRKKKKLEAAKKLLEKEGEL